MKNKHKKIPILLILFGFISVAHSFAVYLDASSDLVLFTRLAANALMIVNSVIIISAINR